MGIWVNRLLNTLRLGTYMFPLYYGPIWSEFVQSCLQLYPLGFISSCTEWAPKLAGSKFGVLPHISYQMVYLTGSTPHPARQLIIFHQSTKTNSLPMNINRKTSLCKLHLSVISLLVISATYIVFFSFPCFADILYNFTANL